MVTFESLKNQLIGDFIKFIVVGNNEKIIALYDEDAKAIIFEFEDGNATNVYITDNTYENVISGITPTFISNGNLEVTESFYMGIRFIILGE